MCVLQDLADLGLHGFPSNFFLDSTPLTTLDWNPSLHPTPGWKSLCLTQSPRNLDHPQSPVFYTSHGLQPRTARNPLGGRDPIRPASWRPGLFPLRNSRALCEDR